MFRLSSREVCVASARGSLLASGWLALLLPLAAACAGLECDRHAGESLEFRGGNTLANGSYYESGALDEPFLHFPGGRSYDLVHELGGPPTEFHAYLAFSECPLSKSLKSAGGPPRCAEVTETSGGPGIAESAGNQALFEVRSAGVLRVRNDTCAEFYLRVVAETPPLTVLPADTADAEIADAGMP
jgi:hypothetical protein